MKAIVSEDSQQSIANEDTLRLMRNNGISPPTVASITRVRTMASSRPKMWTEVSGSRVRRRCCRRSTTSSAQS
jgi:hypothetical protein